MWIVNIKRQGVREALYFKIFTKLSVQNVNRYPISAGQHRERIVNNKVCIEIASTTTILNLKKEDETFTLILEEEAETANKAKNDT